VPKRFGGTSAAAVSVRTSRYELSAKPGFSLRLQMEFASRKIAEWISCPIEAVRVDADL
jgi:hypothetical protein